MKTQINGKITRIDNQVIAHYRRLVKDGYYIRPKIYDDRTVYELTKDLPNAWRAVAGEMNRYTARKFKELFGFIEKTPTQYFGRCQEAPIKNRMILKYYPN